MQAVDFLIINYDQEKGIYTIIKSVKDFLTEDIPKITAEVNEVFSHLDGLNKIPTALDITDTLEQLNIADESLLDFANNATYAEKTFENFQKYLVENGKTESRLTSVVSSVKSLGASLATGLVTGLAVAGINLLLGKAFEILEYQWNYAEHKIQEGQKAKEIIQEETESYETQKKTLSELSERYSELVDGVKISGNKIINKGLSTEEFEEFLTVSNEIADISPSLVSTWDEQGNKILTAGSNMALLNDQIENYIKLQRNLTHYEVKENIDSQYEGIAQQSKIYESDIYDYNQQIELEQKRRDIFYDLAEAVANSDDEIIHLEVMANQELDVRTVLDELGIQGLNAEIGLFTGVDGQTYTAFNIDKSKLDSTALAALQTAFINLAEAAQRSEESIVSLLQSTYSLNQQNWGEIFPSIQTLVDTTSMFDNWDDKALAAQFQSNLSAMVASLDLHSVEKSIEQSGLESNIYEWVLQYLISTLSNSTDTQKELWTSLFELDTSNLPIREAAKVRDEILEEIAAISEDDYWTKNTLAKAFGFAYTNEIGETKWNNQEKLNAIEDAMNSDGKTIREWANSTLTQSDLDIAYNIAMSGNREALQNYESFVAAFEKDKNAIITKARKKSPSFLSLLKTDEEKPENLEEYVDKYVSELGKIKTAQENLKSTGFDMSTALSLASDLPELAGHTDNIEDFQNTLSSLNIEKLREFTSGYLKYISDLTDVNEIATAQDYLNSIVRYYSVSEEFSKQDILDNIGYSKIPFTDVSVSTSDFNRVWQEFSSDGERSAIATLSLNPESATWSYEEWVAKIEEEKPIIELILHEESLSNIETSINKLQDKKALLSSNQVKKQTQGFDITEEDYLSLIAINNELVEENNKKIRENEKYAENASDKVKNALELQNNELRRENIDYESENIGYEQTIKDLPETRLNSRLSAIQSQSDVIDKKDYQNLLKNVDEQIAVYDELISIKQSEIDSLDPTTQSEAFHSATSELNDYIAARNDIESSKIDLGIGDILNDIDVLDRKAQELQDNISIKEANGEDVVVSDYTKLIGNLEVKKKKLDEANTRLAKQLTDSTLSDTDRANIESMIDENESAIASVTTEIAEYRQTIKDLPIGKLAEEMTELQDAASKVQSSLSMKEAKGIKPVLSDYRKLVSNSKEQVKNLQKTNAELRKQQAGLDPLSTRYREIQQQINENVSAIDEAYLSQIEWNEAAESLSYDPNEGLIAYNKAKETRNAGDNYLEMLAAATETQENREKGLIGTDDFKAVAEMFSPNGMNDVFNWDENYGKITRYFTEDEEGVQNFLDDLTQKTNASGEALAVFDEEAETWAYNIDDIKASADALGISFEAFLAIMGRLQDYGFENNYFSSIEEGETRISKLYADLAKQEEKLHDLEIARSNGDETVTNTVLAAQEARVNSIKSQILESQDLLAQLSQKTAEEIETETRGNILSAIAALKEANKLEGVSRKKQIADVYDSLEEMNINLDDLFTFDDTGEVTDILSTKLEEYEKIYRGSLDTIYKYADEDYLKIFDKVSAAVTNPESEIKESLDSLAQYTQEQFNEITFNDKQYGEGVLGEAERTIDELLNSLDLGQDQAKMLLEILGTLGVIDYEIELDTTDIENVVENLTEEKTVPITYETTTSAVTANTEEYEAGISAAVEDANEESATVSIGADDSLARKTVDTLIDDIKNENPRIEISVTEQQVRNTIQDALNKEPFKVEVSANASVSVNGGNSGANGTAHANGTANSLKNSHAFGRACMMGDWGAKKSGRTLVGELGPEIVVNPANSRWYTVGDNGAEFVDLPQNAIVFNHIQSQALMDNGYVHGRGKALAGGNAFANNNGFKFNITASSDDEESKASESLDNVVSSSDEVSDAFQKLIDKLNDAKDWIEVDFSRLQSRIDLQLAKSENEVGYKDKNKRVKNAQDLTDILLKDTRKGLKEYKAYAEKVAKDSGLSKSLKKKVENGTIDIEQLTEKQKLQVEAYQTWYEKIIQCKQSIEELKQAQKELLQQKFDNIIARYDGIISHITHAANLINNSIDLAEAKGYSQSASYYQTLYDNKILEKNKKTAERDALQARLNEGVKNGTIEAPNGKKRGSEEWYELQSEIYELDEGIQEADIDAQKFLNTMREISWTRFDEGHEAIKSVVDEADYLIDLMKNEDMYDDDGKVTEYGTATYGLHTAKLATHQQDITDHNAELAQLEAALAEDPTNTILLERKQQVVQAIRESTKAYQDEKQAIVDLVKNGIEKQLTALKKLIDKYMDAIQTQKDLYDYQNNVKEQAEEIAKLQKRLAAYSGDNSEAGRLKREETEQALKEAQKQLEETQYDKYISDQQDMLDDLYEQYEEVLNDRLKDVGKLIENVQTEVSNQSENINKTLTTTAESVGTTLSTSMDTIWGENGSFTTNFNTAVGGIKEFLQKIYDKADENADNNTDPVEDPGEGTQAIRAGAKAIASKGEKHPEKATDEEKAQHSDLWAYIVDTFGYAPTKGTTKELAKLLNVEVSKNITEKDKDAVYTALRKQLGDTDGKATFSEEFNAIIKTGEKRSKKLTKEEEKGKSKLWQYIVKNYGRQPTSGMFNKLGELFEVGKVSYPPTDKQKTKILKAMQARGYSTGTNETDDEWAWINENGREILTLPNGSIFMPFVEGTGVVNNAKTEEVLKLANNADAIMDMVNAGQRKLDNMRSAQNASAEASLIRAALTDAAGKNGNSGDESITNNVTVNISLPSVTDGKSFLNWAQSNNGFEKLIDSIVFAKMNGKSKLTKQRLKFNE